VKSANSGRSFLISAPPGLGLYAGAADRTIEQDVAGLAQSRFRRLFVFELERGGLDHDAARHARSSDGGDGRRERRRFRQACDDDGRLDGERADIGGERDADAAKRAPTRAIGVVANDPPAGGVKIVRESTAHDAETDDPDNAFLSLRHVVADLAARAAYLLFMFIATDASARASRLATMSLVVAAYFLK
jgi:hypothetical protein